MIRAWRQFTLGAFFLGAVCLPATTEARQTRVRLSSLQDVQFGPLGSGGDALSAQSVCAYSSTNTSSYTVTALGSGNAGEFELSSLLSTLPYEVLWSDQPNMASGSTLQPGVASPAFYSSATHQRCVNGPSSSATIILRISEEDAGSAAAGTYSGALTLILAPI